MAQRIIGKFRKDGKGIPRIIYRQVDEIGHADIKRRTPWVHRHRRYKKIVMVKPVRKIIIKKRWRFKR